MPLHATGVLKEPGMNNTTEPLPLSLYSNLSELKAVKTVPRENPIQSIEDTDVSSSLEGIHLGAEIQFFSAQHRTTAKCHERSVAARAHSACERAIAAIRVTRIRSPQEECPGVLRNDRVETCAPQITCPVP